MMDGQSHLQSEDILVPASVHFDYQTEIIIIIIQHLYSAIMSYADTDTV